VGFQKERFGYFILITMLTNCTSIMLGLSVSAVAADVDHATAVGVPILILGILFGGFYISIDSLPIVANWVPYITIFRWAYQAMCINEFSGLRFDCDAASPSQCILTGEQVLEGLDFAGRPTSYACFGLGMVLLGLTAVAFTLLELSTIAYMPLGFAGGTFKKHQGALGGGRSVAQAPAGEGGLELAAANTPEGEAAGAGDNSRTEVALV
jgi:hypothetical protein